MRVVGGVEGDELKRGGIVELWNVREKEGMVEGGEFREMDGRWNEWIL